MNALCISIHDVAPATWPLCERLAEALDALGARPLTWLVVPCYHGDATRSPAMERALERRMAKGDELVLHGYTHRDPSPSGGGLRERFLRRAYTEAEGEFSALDADAARARLALGMAWFRERGWPLHGFVAPAWLLSDGAWQALRASPFRYTTTFPRFYSLTQGMSLFAPSLVYTARNRLGRAFSPLAASALAGALAGSPLMRLSLHPRDALYPQLVHHTQRLAARLLEQRGAMTKLAFSERYFAPAVQPGSATKERC